MASRSSPLSLACDTRAVAFPPFATIAAAKFWKKSLPRAAKVLPPRLCSNAQLAPVASSVKKAGEAEPSTATSSSSSKSKPIAACRASDRRSARAARMIRVAGAPLRRRAEHAAGSDGVRRPCVRRGTPVRDLRHCPQRGGRPSVIRDTRTGSHDPQLPAAASWHVAARPAFHD
eukprot:1802329-Prymnesium_polylepis.2